MLGVQVLHPRGTVGFFSAALRVLFRSCRSNFGLSRPYPSLVAPLPVKTLRAASAARRRAFAITALRYLMISLAVAGVIDLFLIIAARLALVRLQSGTWVGLLIAVPVASVVTALVAAWLARWSVPTAALELDQRLGLKDRLSSALALGDRSRNGPFIQIVIDEAEHAAGEVHLSRALPARIGRRWIAPLGAVVLCGAAWFIPQNIRGSAPKRPPAIAADEAGHAVASAAATIRDAVDKTPLDEARAAAAKRSLDQLDEITRELAEGSPARPPEEAIAESARAIETTADEIAARSTQDADQVREARRRLAEAARAQTRPAAQGTTSAADEFRRAMREGDVEAARQAAQQLAKQVESLSPEQRESLARELERIAQDLEKPPPESNESTTPPGRETQADNTAPGEQAEEADSGKTEARQPRASDPAARDEPEEPRDAAPKQDDPAGNAADRSKEPDAEQEPTDTGSKVPPQGSGQKPGTEPATERQPPNPSERKPSDTGNEPRDKNESSQDQQGTKNEPKGQPPGTTERGPDGGQNQPASQREQRDDGKRQPEQTEKPSPDGQPSDQQERPRAGDANADPKTGTPAERESTTQEQKPGDQNTGDQRDATGQQSLSDAMREAARDLRRDRTQPPRSEQREARGGESQAPQSAPQPSPQPDQRPPAPEQENQEQGNQEQQAQPQAAPQQQRQQQKDPEQPQDEPGSQPDANQPRPTQPEASDVRDEPGSNKQPDAEQLPARQDDTKPQLPDSLPDAKGLERLAKEFQKLQQRERDAQSQQRLSEDLRKKAEELLRTASPEQRRQLEKMARDMADSMPQNEGGQNQPPLGAGSPKDSDSPGTARDGEAGFGDDPRGPREGSSPNTPEAFEEDPQAKLDARRPATVQPASRPVGRVPQLLGDAPLKSAPVGVSPQAAQTAAKGVERALEQQAIPQRHSDLVRRIFRRIADRAAEAPRPPEAPAPAAVPDAVDAPQR
ncbi:MAG: hypothetical protein AMXMBFR58_37770 [Phycisphaerae bacterium]